MKKIVKQPSNKRTERDVSPLRSIRRRKKREHDDQVPKDHSVQDIEDICDYMNFSL